MIDLKALDDGRKLAEDVVGLLVELGLRREQLGQVAERLRGVENLHVSASQSPANGALL